MFSMSVEEGLKSTNVAVIKEARGVAKGKVTKTINSLKSALPSDNGKFLFELIDEKIVKEIYEKLDSCHDTFTELHERYCYNRVAEKDLAEELKTEEREAQYSEKVATDVSSICREYVKYRKALEAEIENKKSVAENKIKAEEKLAEDSAKDLEKSSLVG